MLRLPLLEEGRGPLQWAAFRMMRAMTGGVAGPIAVMSYRRRFVGAAMAESFQKAMRGAEHWTVEECEIIAAVVSKEHECPYCLASHARVAAAAAKDEDRVSRVLEDLETADVSAGFRATLHFIRAVLRAPADDASDLAARAMDEGVPAEALKEALAIAFDFGVINRVANALDFEIPDERGMGRGVKMLLSVGYGGSAIPG